MYSLQTESNQPVGLSLKRLSWSPPGPRRGQGVLLTREIERRIVAVLKFTLLSLNTSSTPGPAFLPSSLSSFPMASLHSSHCFIRHRLIALAGECLRHSLPARRAALAAPLAVLQPVARPPVRALSSRAPTLAQSTRKPKPLPGGLPEDLLELFARVPRSAIGVKTPGSLAGASEMTLPEPETAVPLEGELFVPSESDASKSYRIHQLGHLHLPPPLSVSPRDRPLSTSVLLTASVRTPIRATVWRGRSAKGARSTPAAASISGRFSETSTSARGRSGRGSQS